MHHALGGHKAWYSKWQLSGELQERDERISLSLEFVTRGWRFRDSGVNAERQACQVEWGGISTCEVKCGYLGKSIKINLPIDSGPSSVLVRCSCRYFIVDWVQLKTAFMEHTPLNPDRATLCVHYAVYQTWFTHAIVLDSNTFLCSIDLAWCNWANQEDQKVGFALFEGISYTRQAQ